METEETIEVRKAGWIGAARVNGQIWLQIVQCSVVVRWLIIFSSPLTTTCNSLCVHIYPLQHYKCTLTA